LRCLLAFLGLARSCAALPGKQVVVTHQDGPGKKGAVATESAVCSQIGADLLRLGVGAHIL